MSDNTVLNPGASGDTIRDLDRSGVKTQVVALDGGGASGESLVSPTNPLPISLSASTFIFSTINTSTAQLAAGATFTGGIEAIPNQPAISVLLTSDMPVTVLVQQFIDAAGVYAVPNVTTVPAIVPAGVGTSFSVPANGNYCRLVVRNVGPNTTTTFNLNTAFGNIDASTPLGNRQTAINEIGGTAVSGTLPVSGTVAVSNLQTFDQQDPATPLVSRIVGRPDGDFAGVDLIEALMDDGSGLSANVRVVNPPKLDVNGATILSDAPAPIYLRGQVNTNIIIDTQGYSSLAVNSSSPGGIGCTFNASDDGKTWSNLSGVNRSIAGTLVTAVSPAGSVVLPCIARYIQLSVNTAGTGVAYLRTAQWPGNYLSALQTSPANTAHQLTNISQIAGANTLATANANGQTMPVTTAGGAVTLPINGALTTSSTIAESATYGGAAGAVMNVTAVSGTGQFMDMVVQESMDGGATWVDVFHFDRMTGTPGVFQMPPIPFAGLKRCSYTIGGTSPSFTTSLRFTVGTSVAVPVFRQFFDRTAGLLSGTASATSSTFMVAGCKTITAAITIGAATTGGIYKLQGSADNANWYDISTTVTAVANSTVQITNTAGVIARFVRLFVSTAASAQTGTVVAITGTN